MCTPEDINELKTLIKGVGNKVNQFSLKLDALEDKFSKVISDVRAEVGQVKNELENTQETVKSLRNSHEELERGVQAMDMQLHVLEIQKLDLLRKSLDHKIKQLREKHVLLKKHERKI